MQYKRPRTNYRSASPHPGILMLAPDATKGGVDEEEAAQSYLGRTSWCLFQVLASVVPRGDQLGDGSGLALVRRRLPGYLGGRHPRGGGDFGPRSFRRSDDNTKSKTMTRTNNPPRAPAGGLAQRRALTGYVMTR